MKLKESIRGCDIFGAPIGLNRAGSSSYPTTGGGLASVALKIFIFSFLCMRLVDVVAYNDFQINTFTVLDSRESM